MSTPTDSPLPLALPVHGRTQLNPSVWFVDRDGYRVVLCRHEPLYRVALADVVHLRLVAVSLRQSQLATQEEIAQAFGHAVATQQRWELAYRRHGLEGLEPKSSPGRRPALPPGQEAFLRRWFAAGVANVEMARRLGVSATVIHRALKGLGLQRRAPSQQPSLPGLAEAGPPADGCAVALPADANADAAADAPAVTTEPADAADAPAATTEPADTPAADPQAAHEPARVAAALPKPAAPAKAAGVPAEGFTLDHDPRDRSGDRLLARQGLLVDAKPLFADAEALPRAGVLLAVPLLERHGLVDVFGQVYQSLQPAFYGLRTIVVTLFLSALLRLKRPEHLKEYRPEELGRILGLDRAPEVKTVRRKLSRLAALGRGQQLMTALARRRIAADEDRIAFLYVDGHVREYSGKHRLFQAKKAQRQVVTPATTDTWVHDAQGEPLLVITSQVNAKLTQVLEPILQEVRRLVPAGRRLTVIFDRGGFSAKLFARLLALGFDLITYRKGKVRPLPRHCFTKQREQIDGVWQEYDLCDRPRVRVGALRGRRRRRRRTEPGQYLWLREVRVLRADGRQTPILSNRQDVSTVAVAYRMFQRWRQENFFKYMDEEFALDALAEYGAEDLAETVDRRNPQWLKLTRQLQAARAEVARVQADLGQKAAANAEAARPTMRGFKIAHAPLRRRLEQAEARVQRLLQQRQKTPKRIPATDLQALKTEKKRIVDAIKMAAYQVETELLGMLKKHYARAEDEGRTLLHAAFQSPARLEVADGELRVTIASQSSPHRTAALAALCADLDAMKVAFPGTQLCLRVAVEPHQPLNG
jgi:transposase